MRRSRYKCFLLATAWTLLGRTSNGAGAQSDDFSAGVTPSPTEGISDYPDCAGYLPHANDGYCDEANNNAECGFDGGDCCHCTCVDGPSHSCGELGGGYDCQDPDVPDDCGSTPSPAAGFGYPNCTGYLYSFQNGYCNDDLNVADCGYDGGDCCRCTCRNYSPYDDDWSSACDSDGFDCQDPSAPDDCAQTTDSPTPSPTGGYSDYPDCTGTLVYISDGDCDSVNNNAECGYDGGDCCSCTCVDGSFYTCGSFVCVDPDAACSSTSSSSATDDDVYLTYNNDYYRSTSVYDDDACTGREFGGTGFCSSTYNTPECDYDGGDCCECTCVDADYTCGDSGYECIDPSAYCAELTQTPSPTEDDSSYYDDCSWGGFVADGFCDSSSNTLECGYDGGDCCECTCVTSEYECGSGGGYNCLDPTCTSRSIADDDGVDAEAISAESSSTSSESGRVVIGSIVVAIFAFCCFGGLIVAGLATATKKFRVFAPIIPPDNAMQVVPPTAPRPPERVSLPPTSVANEESKHADTNLSQASRVAQMSYNDRRIAATMMNRSMREQTIAESLYQDSTSLQKVFPQREASDVSLEIRNSSGVGAETIGSQGGRYVGNGVEEWKGVEPDDGEDDGSVWSSDEDRVPDATGTMVPKKGEEESVTRTESVVDGSDEESSVLTGNNGDSQKTGAGGTAAVEIRVGFPETGHDEDEDVEIESPGTVHGKDQNAEIESLGTVHGEDQDAQIDDVDETHDQTAVPEGTIDDEDSGAGQKQTVFTDTVVPNQVVVPSTGESIGIGAARADDAK